jgi:hypothetical protein
MITIVHSSYSCCLLTNLLSVMFSHINSSTLCALWSFADKHLTISLLGLCICKHVFVSLGSETILIALFSCSRLIGAMQFSWRLVGSNAL